MLPEKIETGETNVSIKNEWWFILQVEHYYFSTTWSSELLEHFLTRFMIADVETCVCRCVPCKRVSAKKALWDNVIWVCFQDKNMCEVGKKKKLWGQR